jgi:hypothetical protein
MLGVCCDGCVASTSVVSASCRGLFGIRAYVGSDISIYPEQTPGRAHASAASAAPAAGVRMVADASASGYSSGPAVSVSPIGGGERVAQCQCQGPRSRMPACSQRARPPHYWQAGTSSALRWGERRTGASVRSFQWCVICGCDGPSVYARRWERSSVRLWVLGVRVRGPQDHEHPPLTTQGWKCCQT